MGERTGRTKARAPLTRERIVAAAVALVDERGLESLSMRRLGAALGVEAMSLYNHVANKDDLLDAIADAVAAGFSLPREELGWREAIRGCSVATHEVLLRHPWAATLLESRTQTGPARSRFLDELLGTFRRAGFPVQAAYRANLMLDSYVYGFTLQEVSWPLRSDDDIAASAADAAARGGDGAYPHLVEVAALVAASGFDRQREFELGLDLILDVLEQLRTTESG